MCGHSMVSLQFRETALTVFSRSLLRDPPTCLVSFCLSFETTQKPAEGDGVPSTKRRASHLGTPGRRFCSGVFPGGLEARFSS